ncbi:GntR family transcriptional regulator [Parafrigoribacterium mesophilum]|uniref:GntR family transcriptional regulator n=1 Tax=Parafrigoribacterium mesophilum TaxID=433646 RepID=UPI0031FC14E8
MSAVPPAEHSVASHRIAGSLREEILHGALRPGERLRQEDIAERFGASRLPVREALRILESDGLVTLVANTGAWVAKLSLAECSELYRIRERLEPLLLAESIPGLPGGAVDRLEELATSMEHTPDIETFLRLDREFHLLSFSAANTALLGDIVRRLWNTTQHYRRAFAQLVDVRANHAIHHEHHLLVDAIARGDLDEAERVQFGHIRRTRLELVRHPEIFQGDGAPL